MTGVTQAVFMNQRSFGSGWIATLGSSSQLNYGLGIALDSSRNVYVTGYYSSGKCLYTKYNASGAVQTTNYFGDVLDSEGRGIAVDSSGNYYIVGSYGQSGYPFIELAKINTSGSTLWQRSLGISFDVNGRGYGIAVDSSGNVYVVGYMDRNSGPTYIDMQIAKYDTFGTLQWQRSLSSGTSINTYGRGIALDSSGNVYVVGYHNVSGNYQIQLAKYNTSGVIQWQRSLGVSGSNVYGYGIAVDASSNIYVIGHSSASSPASFQLAKYDTNGVIQWQRSLGSGTDSASGNGITVDSSGNVYFVGNLTGSVNSLQIAKYNTSGNIQWQRRLYSSGLTTEGYSIAVDSVSNVYVAGKTTAGAPGQVIMASLPNDGTKTGTYSVGGYSYTYEASSLTDASTSLTDATSSLTDAATSLTSTATPLTWNFTALTSNTTQI